MTDNVSINNSTNLNNSTALVSDKQITGIECRFVVHCPPSGDSQDDLHLVKELIYFSDGTTKPNVRLIKNYKRDFYIIKPGHRNFKQKKEYIELDKCIKYQSTQYTLLENIIRALKTPWFKGSIRKLFRDPYIYGADILSTALLKKQYQDKYPNLNSMYSVAVFDTETDMINGTEDIVMATLTYKDKAVTAIDKSFLAGYSNVESRLNDLLIKYLSEHVEARKIKWEVFIVDSPGACVVECFKKAHEWQPDWIAIWNLDFDIPKCLKALEKAGIDPKDVFSDPKVPKEFKHFNYKQGSSQKVTESGKQSSKANYEQWHTVECPSSFYFIDAMCVYYQIRSQSGGKEQSYSLDSILDKHLGIRKLKFKESDHLVKAEWHQYMQSKYPLEYVIYNVFDCISMELLDEKILDLSLTVPQSGISDFRHFKSQPRRLVDNLHFFCLENNKVIGTTSDAMVHEYDSLTTDLKNWIITLPAHLLVANGLKVIEEDPNLVSSIRVHIGDLDVSASYPNGGSALNLSRETTHKELIAIKGIPLAIQKQCTINLSGGATNATEICTGLYKVPSMDEFLIAFNSTDI